MKEKAELVKEGGKTEGKLRINCYENEDKLKRRMRIN
jgi:hypothetical protein